MIRRRADRQPAARSDSQSDQSISRAMPRMLGRDGFATPARGSDCSPEAVTTTTESSEALRKSP